MHAPAHSQACRRQRTQCKLAKQQRQAGGEKENEVWDEEGAAAVLVVEVREAAGESVQLPSGHHARARS